MDIDALERIARAATPGEWECVPSDEHHGPYVAGPLSGDICDCYVMSQPSALSTAAGGPSKPIHHQHDKADANAAHIATFDPPTVLALIERVRMAEAALRAIQGGAPSTATARTALEQLND